MISGISFSRLLAWRTEFERAINSIMELLEYRHREALLFDGRPAIRFYDREQDQQV